MIKTLIRDLVFAVLAGVCIALGGMAFLVSSQKLVGAVCFVIGLFMILNFNFNLFTGKVCVALDQKPSYLLNLFVIWIGNWLGTLLTAVMFNLTRLHQFQDVCRAIVDVKLNDHWYSLLILGIFCNILIYLAVYGYKNFEHGFAKVLALFFGVAIFVYIGFEHCVADMFYFAFANEWSWSMFGRLLLITCGNIIGGLLLPGINKIMHLIKSE